jgi:sulfur carrier protein
LIVQINNQDIDLPEGATLAEAVRQVGAMPPFAAAVNMQFVPNRLYSQTVLRPGDGVEIIRPVTGG